MEQFQVVVLNETQVMNGRKFKTPEGKYFRWGVVMSTNPFVIYCLNAKGEEYVFGQFKPEWFDVVGFPLNEESLEMVNAKWEKIKDLYPPVKEEEETEDKPESPEETED